jgi:hypothetical protein
MPPLPLLPLKPPAPVLAATYSSPDHRVRLFRTDTGQFIILE